MSFATSLRHALIAAGVFAALAAPVEARTIKFGHFGSPNTPFDQGVQFFAHKLEEISGGKLKVVDYPSGQLGNEAQEIGALQGGLQEMLSTSSTNLVKYNPRFKLIDIPFAFPDDAATDRVLLGPVGQEMLDGLKGSGMVGLGYMDNGFRDLSNSKRPIATLADFKGLNFRVLGSPVFIDLFKALGANPVPMPFSEVYSALETGTVDGQDNPLVTVRDLKFYEVQKYLTPSKHAYSALPILISEPFWNSLSDLERSQIKEAVVATEAENRRLMRDTYTKALEFLGTEGKLQISTFSPEALAEIRTAVQPVVDGIVTPDLKPLYEQMEAAIAK